MQKLDDSLNKITFKNYIRIVHDKIYLILFFIIVTFAVVGFRTYTTTPLFQASTKILIEENLPVTLIEQQRSYTPLDPTFLQTQYQIVTSPVVVFIIIFYLKLDSLHRDHFLGPKVEEGTEPGIKQKIKGVLKAIIKKIVSSKAEEKKEQSQFNANGDERPILTDRDKIRRIIAGNLNITPLPDTKIVRLNYIDTSPTMAALVANSIVDAYKDELMKIKMDSVNYSLAWMQQEAIKEEKKFQDLEERKSKYAREHNIITVENRLTDIPVKLNQFNSNLADAERRLQELKDINNQIETHKNNISAIESIPYIANNTALRSIKDQTLALNRRIAELSKKYGPKHPRMVETRNELRSLNENNDREIDKILQSIEKEYELALETVRHRKEALQQTQQEALTLNEKLNEYQKISRELGTSRILHDSLLKRMKEQSVKIQEKNVKVWVVEKAIPPLGPFKPNKKLNLALALIIGSAAGLGCAFLLDYLDDSIRDPEDIERRFNTPILGIVEKVVKSSNNDRRLYIGEGSFSTLSESYKIIRSALLLSSPDNPPKVILLTSTAPGDGKTTTTINLAYSLSMLKSGNVLVIDCDLRKPRLHANLNVVQENGLSSCLAGVEPDVSNVIYTDDELPFDVIPAGPLPPNPSELLSSKRMRSILSELRNKYHFILLDSPPIFGAIDGLHLSPLTDGTILVTRANRTTRDLYRKVLHRLNSVNARVLGTIINAVVIKKANLYHYSGYYSSYGEYGSSSSSGKK